MSLADYATDNLPADLPPGAYRLMDHVYAVPIESMPQTRASYYPLTNIGTVPGFGNIVQPFAFRDITLGSASNRYIHVECNSNIRINFLENGLVGDSIFGSDCFNWPTTSPLYVIWIDAIGAGMTATATYQLQCTGLNDYSTSNVMIGLVASPSTVLP